MRILLRTALLCAVALPSFACAYYDDVHFALTYYLARRTGLTVEQSFRLASACSSVDWDEHTEPVQPHGQVALLADRGHGLIDLAEWGIRKAGSMAVSAGTGALAEVPQGVLMQQVMLGHTSIKDLREAASYARYRYHAFRNELDYVDPVGKDAPDGAEAELDVTSELKELFEDAVEHKNLGVYMHAYQDFRPHQYYGTTWGHNPFAPDHFKKHFDRKLPIGSTTDWVSFRRQNVEDLCNFVNIVLRDYLKQVSPHQHVRTIGHQEYAGLVTRLAKQKAPEPMTRDIQRQIFIRAYARSKGINLNAITATFVDFVQLEKIADDMGVGISPEDIQKHIHGPNIGTAIAEVNEELKARGMRDKLRHSHFQYDITEEGYPEDGWEDDWVLVGDLTLKTRGTGEPVTITLKQTALDQATGKEKDLPLKLIPPFRLGKGEMKELTDLPIGKLTIEIRRQDGSTAIERIRLLQQKNESSVFLKAVAKKPTPAKTAAKPPAKPPTKPTEAAAPKNADFTGTWRTTQGRFAFGPVIVKLSQSGTNVSGSFTIPDGQSGSFTGTVKGRVFSFTYTFGSETGNGSFTMSEDGKRIEGTYNGGNRWGGPKEG